jgi:hypothetical protein
MTVMALKKPEPSTGPRARLHEAIIEAQKARNAVEAAVAAIERVGGLVAKAEAELKEANSAVVTALDQAARALAESLTSGGGSSPALAVRQARAVEQEAADEVEAARAARKRLQADLTEAEAELRQAEKAVDVAVAATLEPVAREMFAEALRRRAEWQETLFALDMLRPQLGPGHDLGREIARLTYIDRFAAEDRALALKVRAAWTPALAALRSDPEAQLPE